MRAITTFAARSTIKQSYQGKSDRIGAASRRAIHFWLKSQAAWELEGNRFALGRFVLNDVLV
jgi:hypothetical protein